MTETPDREPTPLSDNNTHILDAGAASEVPAPDGTPEPEADDSSSGETESGDINRARRDAAKYRARLRETESERDTLRDQLAAQRRAIVDWRANSGPGVSVDPALLDAASIDVETMLGDDDGLDMGKVDEFIGATAERFKVAKGFSPNRAQGMSGAPAARPSMADAFRRR